MSNTKGKKDGDNKHSENSIFVHNLPFDTTNEKLEEYFGEVGPIRRCFILTEKGSKICNGNAIVTYSLVSDAEKALKKFNLKKFHSKAPYQMTITKARKKDKGKTNEKGVEDFLEEEKKEKKQEKKGEEKQEKEEEKKEEKQTQPKEKKTKEETKKSKEETKKPKIELKEIKEEPMDEDEKVASPPPKKVPVKKEPQVSKPPVKSAEKPKKPKALKSSVPESQKGRLIVRNLAFSMDEASLRKEFEKIGELEELRVPTIDGKRRGFAFVKYKDVENSAKALESLNGVEMKGRAVAVDWAVPKATFDAIAPQIKQVKEEKEVKEESEEESEEGSEEEEEEEDGDDEEESEEDEEEDDDEEEEEEGEEETKEEKKPKTLRYDGEAIFVTNLAYDTKEDAIQETFSRFGKVNKVYLVQNKVTGGSKGNAFVYFKDKEGVEEVMKDIHRYHLGETIDESQLIDSNITLDGRVLRIAKQTGKREAESNREKADKRNFYLLQEGFIPFASPAANGMSAKDGSKREASLAERKTKMRNSSNFFVSKTRLSVRNIPKEMQEKELKRIFMEPVKENKEARIINVKILKEKDRNDQSRGFGFLEFTRHEDALQALRALNNNPNIFSKTARPIVEFAVENAVKIMQSKHKRGEITEKNPVKARKSTESYGKKRKAPQEKSSEEKSSEEKPSKSETKKEGKPKGGKKFQQNRNKRTKTQ